MPQKGHAGEQHVLNRRATQAATWARTGQQGFEPPLRLSAVAASTEETKDDQAGAVSGCRNIVSKRYLEFGTGSLRVYPKL